MVQKTADGSLATTTTYEKNVFNEERVYQVKDERRSITSDYTYDDTSSQPSYDLLSVTQKTASGDLINTMMYEQNIFGEDRITKIEDRKEVKQAYIYHDTSDLIKDGDLEKVVTPGKGAIVYYNSVYNEGPGGTVGPEWLGKNKFFEDWMGASEDYKGTITHYDYDKENGFLEKSYSTVQVADFVGDKIVPKDSTTTTLYTQNTFYEDVARYTISAGNTVTYYDYNIGTGALAYSEQFDTVPGADVKELLSGDLSISDLLTRYEGNPAVKITKTYYQKNEYGEEQASFVQQPNGIWVFYNYEELPFDPLADDTDPLKYRTVVTRTTGSGLYSSFDSITILNKYGDVSTTIDSNGVALYSRYIPEDAGVGGIPNNEQTNVLDSVSYYDLNGRLLKIDQTEVMTLTVAGLTFAVQI